MEGHVSDSDAVAVGDGFGFNGEEIPPSQSQELPVLDFAAGNGKIKIAMEEEEEEEEGKQEQPPPPSAVTQQSEKVVDSLKDKIASAVAGEEQGSALELEEVELKKKRLLQQLQSVLLPLPKDDFFSAQKTTVQVQQHLPLPSSLGIGIQVIDETALLQTIPPPASAPLGIPNKTTTKKKDNAKQSRRRAATHSHRSVSVTELTAPNGTKPINSTSYSRKQMEALRFVNLAQQRKFWKSIYAGLQSVVAKEYDTLATTHHHNHNHNNKPGPPILSVGAANGRWRYMNVFVH